MRAPQRQCAARMTLVHVPLTSALATYSWEHLLGYAWTTYGLRSLSLRGPPGAGCTAERRHGDTVQEVHERPEAPRCTQCNEHWTQALPAGPKGRHLALKCQPPGWHWSALRHWSASLRLALVGTGALSASSCQDTGHQSAKKKSF
jgi:hypothetical protein